MNDAIVTEHLIKIYNDGTKALDDISINIKSKVLPVFWVEMALERLLF
jgi:hypothetical protein